MPGRRTSRGLLAALALFAVFAAPTAAATCTDPCWIDQATGDDSNDGSQTSPLKTIQAGVDAVDPNGFVLVGEGTYNESVTVNKIGVDIAGAGPTRTIISGPKTAGHTLEITAGGAFSVVESVGITRDGNNTTDWASNANSYGLKVHGDFVQVLQVGVFGNRNGVYVESADGFRLTRSDITNNRTGLHLVNDVSGLYVKNNTITGNWTMGVLFRDEMFSPLANPTSGVEINDNDLSGNWYSAIEARTLLTNTINAEHNWFGTVKPTAVAGTSGEPGYAAQIPVAYGGTAVAPGGAKNVVYATSNTSNPVDFSPWRCTGASNSTLTGFDPTGYLSPCLLTFTGFYSPVDMDVTNAAKAGQNIPIKLRVTDGDGDPITTDPGLLLQQSPTACATSLASDAVETYASSAGDWNHVGDGVWQYNWKTNKAWAGTCRSITVTAPLAGEGIDKTALFSFK